MIPIDIPILGKEFIHRETMRCIPLDYTTTGVYCICSTSIDKRLYIPDPEEEKIYGKEIAILRTWLTTIGYDKYNNSFATIETISYDYKRYINNIIRPLSARDAEIYKYNLAKYGIEYNKDSNYLYPVFIIQYYEFLRNSERV